MKVKSLELRVKSQEPWAALRSNSGSRLLTLDSRLSRPRGMTLIELLVVIIIITTLVAAAIPLLAPSNDDRRIREASRGLNTYITGAQARAISLHRPYGIALKRLSQDTNTNKASTSDIHPDNGACLEVFYVEQQAPYAGFDVNSRACVAIHPTTPGYAIVRFVTRSSGMANMPVGWSGDLFPSSMIRPDDLIEINGTQFRLLGDSGALSDPQANIQLDANGVYFEQKAAGRPPQILAVPMNDSGQQINPKYDDNGRDLPAQPARPPFWASPAPYKILRQPTFTSDEPYQLPEGTAIDLRASGFGVDDHFYKRDVPGVVDGNDNSAPILIMFTPEGRVARVMFSKLPLPPNANNNELLMFDKPVVDNVYLLVGRRDRIAAPEVGSDPTLQTSAVSAATTDEARTKLKEPINWLSGDSRWITIGSQTGRVVTVENGAVDMAGVLSSPLRPFDTANPSTEEMRNAQILSAREFTHEMGQLGGR